MKKTKILKLLFFLTVTLLIFYLIFQKIDFFSLKDVLLQANLPYLVAAFLLIFSITFFSAKQWQVMVRAMNYSLSFKDSFKIIMATYPVSAVGPARSGELIKAYYLKDKLPISQTMGAVIVERFISALVLAFYSLVGALILKNELILGINLLVIFLILLFFLVINKIKLPSLRWQERLESFLHISKIFVRQPKKLLPVLFYALISGLMYILAVKLLFLALGANLPILYIVAALPMAIFVGFIPITITGMGTRDSVIIYFFSIFTTSTICLGVGLLYSLFTFWLVALLGLPFMKKYYN